ncbi:NAD-dependent epimerase/dehydratase family protein [Faecalibacterium prausnitzii]|jgi:NAD-dependent epimerase/dehydratase|uniref:NAD-dependent epimerase/dehydratase family protein n=1 Tax=Faecalibacterium prausnitzii TaxID=853 RepID=UPI003A1EBCFA
MKKAIVSGANGFVGTALCKELANQGVAIIAIVRNSNSNIESLNEIKGIRIVYADLSDYKHLDDQIKDKDIDVFYHLAWNGTAGTLRSNSDVQLDNVKHTCDAVRACSRMQCQKFIFASSIMEYEIESLMQTERTPTVSTIYSTAKITADYMARTISGALGIKYVRALISNIYGPGETSPRLINTTIRKLLKGEHCAFSPGDQIYDFIYITDAAKAFVAIGEKGVANRTYYIGSQNPRPLKEFLCELRDQVNSAIEIGLGEIPFEGVSLTYNEFHLDAVERDTGFKPSVTFKEGILNTVDWIKEGNQ